MFKRIILVVSFPLALSLLAGCATTVQTVKGYEGARRAPAKLAVVNIGMSTEVDAVDGHALARVCSGEMNSRSLTYKLGCKLTLIPGKHTLSVGYQSSTTSSFGGVTGTTTKYSKYLAVVPVSAQSGKTYFLNTDFPPFRIYFGDKGWYGAGPLRILRYVKR